MLTPAELHNVTVHSKANVYFEGNVVSHTIITSTGDKKTLGLIHPGQFHFGTEKAERMQIVSGSCWVKVDGADAYQEFTAGTFFDVPAESGFHIEVQNGICEYLCSFLG
jgi:uncharacterized protein YaiE (UPF0345 family)